MHRLGSMLIVVGLLAVAFGVAWQFGLVPGSRVSLPPPVALQRTPTPIAAPTAALAPAIPLATSVPPAAEPTPPPQPVAPLPYSPDAEDRHRDAQRPPPGYAVRLAIPSIKLESDVQQGGIVADADGNPSWETLPFVAVHYGDLTSLIGARGNAVIAGHVVTLREGNVFRFLYQLDLDDEIQVWDKNEREHDFRVVGVKLVAPSDTSVMAPTPDETLTLITCGGTFDPIKREFSERLIVTAKPI
ncbi:MAG TPA: class F sortase [Chloroflexota bacterium]